MNIHLPATFLFAAAALVAPLAAQDSGVQSVSKEVRVNVKKIQVQAQKTPDFSVNNVTEKRWKPREWIEIEVQFDAQKAAEKAKEDGSRYIDVIEFKYFVAFNAKDRTTGKTKFAAGTVSHVNIPSKEDTASVMYISPQALEQILEKTSASNSDIQAVAVEVYYNGELCGRHTIGGGNDGWWKLSESLTDVGSVMLEKPKTPFAPLWGDYHADVQQR